MSHMVRWPIRWPPGMGVAQRLPLGHTIWRTDEKAPRGPDFGVIGARGLGREIARDAGRRVHRIGRIRRAVRCREEAHSGTPQAGNQIHNAAS